MRPTISMAMIIKNERANLPRLFESIKDCFDEIHITDTGSNDGSVEWLKEHGDKFSNAIVFIHHFEWCDDFAKARNYAFSQVKTDYVYWQDGDDVLKDAKAFIQWRDFAMEHADYWLANYHYTIDSNGRSQCTFVRERVMKMSLNPQWNYFVHEGVKPGPGWRCDMVHTWSVTHLRTAEDQKADKGRNLKLLQKYRGEPSLAPGLDSRMQFYLGKEFYDNGKFEQALPILVDAATKPDLELHDRILALQFGGYAALYVAGQLKPEFAAEKLSLAAQLAQQGLQLDPKRAEFHCLIGETFIQKGDLLAALPCFSAAEYCITPEKMGMVSMSPIFNFHACYEEIPKINKAKIFLHINRLEDAEKELKECVDKYRSPEAIALLAEVQKMKPLVSLTNKVTKNSDIVFTCPPHQAYPFDEEIYKTKALGGSETALVQMAKFLKEKTGRKVIVFNVRDHDLISSSGVEWRSNRTLNEYMSKNEPAVHIAWRHNIKVTKAPTYLWGHDLQTPGIEQMRNFDQMLCLSEFHKNYTMAKQGVPENQIIVTRNGITPEKFDFKRKVKNPNKIVWMSSPDRGLDRAMLVCDEILKTHPNIELHVYNMFDNMIKYGLAHEAERLKAMMNERPYVKFHGFTEQSKMYHEVSDAVLWLHPCNFIETFCITALEMLALGVFPVTRKLGALANTLADAASKDQAILLDHDCVTPLQIQAYAHAALGVLESEQWNGVSLPVENYSWESVATEWIQFMGLKEQKVASVS